MLSPRPVVGEIAAYPSASTGTVEEVPSSPVTVTEVGWDAAR